MIRSIISRAVRSYVLFVALGLLVGLTIAPVAWQTAESDSAVAVVPVAGTIDGSTADAYGSMLKRARQDPEIEAVVLVANSGGGSASASEEMYLQTKRTAKRMPVVTSVDAAALSGAYYTIAPSDRIYAKPSSLVGSVGVLASAPTDVEPNDIIATTGPNKLSGGDEREFYATLESLGNAFYSAVEASRGDRLELSRTELAQARFWSGTQAVRNGMADAIGGQQAAIAYAAEQAGLEDYEVKRLRPDDTIRFLSRANYLAADMPNKTMVDPSYLLGDESETPTFLMVAGSYLDEADDGDRSPAPARNGSPTRPSLARAPEVNS